MVWYEGRYPVWSDAVAVYKQVVPSKLNARAKPSLSLQIMAQLSSQSWIAPRHHRRHKKTLSAPTNPSLGRTTEVKTHTSGSLANDTMVAPISMNNSNKRVRFPPNLEEMCRVVCHLPNCADLDPDESANMWYKKSDLQKGRVDAKHVSRQCHADGQSRFLDNTYAAKSASAQEKLLSWTSKSSSSNVDDARGLERWTNKRHGELRQDDQFKALMAVLEAQDNMVMYGEDSNLDWEKLRKVYQDASKVARHFARMMGKADSYAIASELRRTTSSLSSCLKADNDNASTRNISINTSGSSPRRIKSAFRFPQRNGSGNNNNNNNIMGDSDCESVTTTQTDTSLSPPKKHHKSFLGMNNNPHQHHRKDLLELHDSGSNHSISPLKRFRQKLKGKGGRMSSSSSLSSTMTVNRIAVAVSVAETPSPRDNLIEIQSW
jgi:hypothetical protein